MSHELFYTSAPLGLKPGSKGFCTVAMTAGMSAVLVQRLEMLSGYSDLFPPGDPRSSMNPIAYSHWRIQAGERTSSLLSRVCPAGMDYTHRANTFAHHILVDQSEQSSAGPAWVMSQPGVMEASWDGAPRLLPRGRDIPAGEDPAQPCSAWKAATGDAGWAGVLAETAASDGSKVAYIIYSPGTEVLELIREAMTLLTPHQRWLTTFSTYFTDLPAGLTCNWRCCVAETGPAKEAEKHATSGIVIDLTKQAGIAKDGPLVEAARLGELAAPALGGAQSVAPGGLQWKSASAERTRWEADHAPLKSIQSLARQNDGSPVLPPSGVPTADEYSAQIPQDYRAKRKSPRTRYWLIAIIWPLLVIPGVIVWHLTSESQARRDLEARKASLESDVDALQAVQQGDRDALVARVASLERALSNERQKAAGFHRDFQSGEQSNWALSEDNWGLWEQLAFAKEVTISNPTTRRTSKETAPVKAASQPSVATNEMAPEANSKPGGRNAVTNSPSWQIDDLADEQGIMWQANKPGTAAIELFGPLDSQIQVSHKRNEASVRDSTCMEWFRMSDKGLQRIPSGVPSRALKNWLAKSYIRLTESGGSVTRIRFAPQADVDETVYLSGKIKLDLPAEANPSDKEFALKFAGDTPDGWSLSREGNSWACMYHLGDAKCTLIVNDSGELHWEAPLDSTQPATIGASDIPAAPLVLEVIYRYADDDLKLCTLTLDFAGTQAKKVGSYE